MEQALLPVCTAGTLATYQTFIIYLRVGWDDGKIRGFGPESGLLQYTITDAHKDGVTALDVCDPSNEAGDFRLVTGGVDGQVRVWKVTREKQSMENAMKEHKGNPLPCFSSSSESLLLLTPMTSTS